MGQVVVADVSGVQDEIEKISFFELYGELLFCRTLLSVARQGHLRQGFACVPAINAEEHTIVVCPLNLHEVDRAVDRRFAAFR